MVMQLWYFCANLMFVWDNLCVSIVPLSHTCKSPPLSCSVVCIGRCTSDMGGSGHTQLQSSAEWKGTQNGGCQLRGRLSGGGFVYANGDRVGLGSGEVGQQGTGTVGEERGGRGGGRGGVEGRRGEENS